MFELKISSPEFVKAALIAGKMAGFEGAILLLTRGLNPSLEEQLADSWGDLDDITHNEILVLTLGISNRYPGIPAFGIQRNVLAKNVAVKYPSSNDFSGNFEQLLQVANHVPDLQPGNDIQRTIFKSHGMTDVRRSLNISESSLPALLIISFRQKVEYLIELGSSYRQLSPIELISAIAINLDDVPYHYRKLGHEISDLSEKNSKLFLKIRKNEKDLEELNNDYHKRMARGQLESVIFHINETIIDAPNDIKEVGGQLIDFLSGVDEKPEVIEQYKLQLIEYARSKSSVASGRLPKKLNRAVQRRLRNEPFQTIKNEGPYFSREEYLEKQDLIVSEISELRKQKSIICDQRTAVTKKRELLDIDNAFRLSVETMLKKFDLKLESTNATINSLRRDIHGTRLTYTYVSGYYRSLDDRNNWGDLHLKLMDHFNLEEFHTLCFSLGIDPENFPPLKESFSRELLKYILREGRISELMDYCERNRPNVSW